MALDYLETEKRREQKVRDEHWLTYQKLTKAYALGLLSKSDFATLTISREALGVSLEKIEQDAATFRKEVELAAEAVDLPAIVRDLQSQTGKLDALRAEFVKQHAAFREQERVLLLNIGNLNRGRDRKAKAETDLAMLRRERWELLGCESPAVLDRRCHLVSRLSDVDLSRATYEVFTIENFFADPTSIPPNWNTREVMPVDGLQTADDVAELTQCVAEIRAQPSDHRPRNKYLLEADVDRSTIRRVDVVSNMAEHRWECEDLSTVRIAYKFWRYKGQSAEQLADRLREWTRRQAEALKDGSERLPSGSRIVSENNGIRFIEQRVHRETPVAISQK